MRRPKIKACRPAWKAYKIVFVEINRRMTLRPIQITNEDKMGFLAYRKVMNYARSPKRRLKRGIIKTDWELYKESYENAIALFNRLGAFESRRALQGYCESQLTEGQKDFLFGFVELLEYACELHLDSLDYRKVRNFTRKLRAAANWRNRTKA